jgi:ubiquinone/menaquinone biosynthesis C-methylase UbiE
MHKRGTFYQNTIARWIPDRNASILVAAGGKLDRDVYFELGFQNVVISNLNQNIPTDYITPYLWSRQDVQSLTYKDQEFDYVVIHAGLHHCHSPHKGLLEMYRVAKKAVIVFEPPDNFLVRLMQKVGLAQTYEYIAVQRNEGVQGGVDNTEIPNYIYRWTEKEVEKAIRSYDPKTRHYFKYAYDTDEPFSAFIAKNKLKRYFIHIAKPIYNLFGRCFPKQRNLFAFYVEKPNLSTDLLPWLKIENDVIRYNSEWNKG